MVDCKLASITISHGFVLCRDDSVDKVDEAAYISVVETLMFLTHYRPNIAYWVSLVSRYMTSSPYKLHMKIVKIILWYVKGTLNFGIHYYNSKEFNLGAFNDSD